MRIIHFRDEQLAKICSRVSTRILDTMQVMNDNGLRLVPVLENDSDRFFGVLSDGDIRRYLTQGGNLKDPLKNIVNTDPKILTKQIQASDLRATMTLMRVEFLPVVIDEKLVGFHAMYPTLNREGTTAVIMAGGLGSRLSPLTDNCPKPLLELNGQPILSHIINELRDLGFVNFIICVNYLSDQIMNYYGDGSRLGVNITYIHEHKRLGTGGALSLINSDMLSEPFLCLNGDIINDVDIGNLLECHENSNWLATMVVCDHNYNVPYGVVRHTIGGSYLSCEEKPIVKFKINAGIYMISKKALVHIPADTFYDLPNLFEDLTKNALPTGIYTHTGRWIDIGNVSEFERAKIFFEKNTSL